jgi:endoglucanase
MHGQLHVEGLYIKDSKGEDVVLRGVSMGWHNWWPQYYNADVIAWLATDWKAGVVRAAMGVDPKKAYIQNPEKALKLVDAVVDAAIAQNIYVIIDWHSHSLKLNEAKGFFERMAQKYGSYPNIIYEIYNEPVYDSWEDVKNYSIEVIKAIRKYDSKNIILIGSPHWSQDVDIAADNPITGYDNIMYTVHFYANTHKEDLRKRCDYALQKGLPLFVSEYGESDASGNGAINYKELDLWYQWMDTNKISGAKWMIADKKETTAALKPHASSKGAWSESDLSETGIAIRKLLREKAAKEGW